MDRIDLDVPFAEKDDVKKLGARWDKELKIWYVPKGISEVPFQKWLPFRNVRSSKWYVSQTIDYCWKCHEDTLFTAILLPAGHETLEADESNSDEEKNIHSQAYWQVRENPAFVFYIDDLPAQVLSHLKSFRHFLSKDYSKTTNSRYWMNHCEHCHAKQGDFPLHCEPNGYFSPIEIPLAEKIQLTLVDSSFTASCGGISHDHIHVHFGDSGVCTAGEMLPWMKIIR